MEFNVVDEKEVLSILPRPRTKYNDVYDRINALDVCKALTIKLDDYNDAKRTMAALWKAKNTVLKDGSRLIKGNCRMTKSGCIIIVVKRAEREGA